MKLDAFSHDLLDRKPFSEKLERFILTEHHFVEGGLVISLNAPFGSGKTTFLNMWSADLRNRRKENSSLPRPVVINAWESDYCGDPLIALISGLSRALEDKTAPDAQPEQANSLREAAKDIGNFALSLANDFVSEATGLDVIAAGEFAEEKKTSRREGNKEPVNLLEAYERKRSALTKLKDTLTLAFGGDEPKAIVFVDELDRCRPDYAIGYLETIKHIFDLRGIVFVLSVDEVQLQSASTVLFGSGLVFSEYYRKFSHRSVKLPMPEKQGISKIAYEYTKRYLSNEGKRWCILQLGSGVADSIVELIALFELTPRQIQELFRVLGHAFSRRKEDDRKLNWAFGAAYIFMGCLRIANRSAYEDLGHGRTTLSELTRLLNPLSKDRHSFEWWFKVVASGFKTDEAWRRAVVVEMQRNQLLEAGPADKIDVSRIFSETLQSWGMNSGQPGLGRVYVSIEEINSFSI